MLPHVPRVDAPVYPLVHHSLLVPHRREVGQAVQAIAVRVPSIGHVQQPGHEHVIMNIHLTLDKHSEQSVKANI